jgi:hypothetical protein
MKFQNHYQPLFSPVISGRIPINQSSQYQLLIHSIIVTV